jgi:hypothetical protein
VKHRLLCLLLAAPAVLVAQSAPPTDLDALMARAIERRAESWKTLRQYVLDEREQVDLRGPGGAPLFGERRDYTWYIRDGYFVRSPVRANGVTIGEDERRKYEDDWIAREKRREFRRAAKDGPPAPETLAPPDPDRVGDFLRQTIEPRFISAAYFLDFKFEPGNYALVGRETIEERDVLKVEYYPAKLFSDDDDDNEHREHADHASERGKQEKDKEEEAIERRMNKVALVTLSASTS